MGWQPTWCEAGLGPASSRGLCHGTQVARGLLLPRLRACRLRPRSMKRALCCAISLALVLAFSAQTADAALHMLACTDSYGARVKFLCSGQGTVSAGQNMTYTIAVDQESAYNQLYSINITLRSVGGDADV